MKKGSVLLTGLLLALVAGGVALRLVRERQKVTPTFSADGTLSALDPSRWVKVSEGDFEECLVDSREKGERLRLRAATRGTRDDTVKFLGARSARKTALAPGTQISARLDWNDQANGSYLSAALILSPQTTGSNPLLSSDWFKVEYIGVPPGENARLLVACKTAGRERFLQTEGWPDANRAGRKIKLVKVEILAKDPGVQVLENGRVVFESKEPLLPSGASHLYLEMSTHSNYPPREIFFDEISFPALRESHD